MRVETYGTPWTVPAERPLRIRLLGPLEIRRQGAVVPLPASRKVRALLAYLCLSPRDVPRSHLCDLLWDVPNDPRGELRWCLSKLRRLVDHDRPRLSAHGDAVRLDLSDCEVDALEVQRRMGRGAAALGLNEAEGMSLLFVGDLLEGLDTDAIPAFAAWLAAQRRRFRSTQVALLERLATQADPERSAVYLERWVEVAPFDQRAHELLLSSLARRGRIREGEEHLAATARRFDESGFDVTPVRRAWEVARKSAASGSPPIVATPASVAEGPESARGGVSAVRRASLAVMPFHETPVVGRSGWAHALARDVITRLAKLRSLFVIAEGTVIALDERELPPEEAGRLLGVDYVVAGALSVRADRLSVDVELDETRTARVIWSERFDARRDDAFDVIEDIGDRVVASIASEIEANERNRALLKPPSSLDAWEAHHRGLWHMYRFTREDNDAAYQFFARAVSLDPTFSRAHAGLSFTHWQSAFQGWAERDAEIDRALQAARRGILIDDRDPAVHWAHGRALWLRGIHDEAMPELLEAVELSPNFAQGHYTLAFVQAQDGDPGAAIESADRSRRLSPFDPLLFGMLGARAIALVRLGRLAEAAADAVKAAARPNAHAHIHAIAAFSLALAGDLDRARAHAAAARSTVPAYSLSHFLKAFRLDRDGEARFAEGARRIGMAD